MDTLPQLPDSLPMTPTTAAVIDYLQKSAQLFDSGDELAALEMLTLLAWAQDIIPAISQSLLFLLSLHLLYMSEHLQHGRVPQAEIIMNRVYRLKPQFPSLHMIRAMILQQKGNIQEALEALDLELEFYPDNSSARDFKATLEGIETS